MVTHLWFLTSSITCLMFLSLQPQIHIHLILVSILYLPIELFIDLLISI